MSKSQPFIMKASQTEPRDWFRIENKKDEDAEVYIYGAIGGSWWDDEAISAKSFADQIKAIKGDKITVHVNSPGGAIFDGLAIYNSLKQHPAEVTVIVDALAASAASFIAMAGDELVMARNAVMMIHDGSGACFGNAKDMKDMADLLDKLSDNIADIYTQRAGGNVDFWREAMKEETWYTGTEAVTAGLADRVLEDSNEAAEKVAASWDLSIFNYAGRDRAPAPAVIHNRIKSMMNEAREATVTVPVKASAEVPGETEEPTPPQVEQVPPGNKETGDAGVNGDGTPVEGSEPANRVTGPITFTIGGREVADHREVQAYINNVETAQKEARESARKDFCKNLVTSNRLPATELTATEEFALELSDTQYDKWTAQWTNAASLGLLASHGRGSTNLDGGPNEVADAVTNRVNDLKEIIAYHKKAGRSDEFIKNTKSFSELLDLVPDFKL